MNKYEAIQRLKEKPYLLGHALGFTKLTELHNNWIIKMTQGKEDETLQSHRGSYKTTCVALAISILMIAMPNLKILFLRKTDSDVKEIVQQIKKILMSDVFRYFVNSIYGVDLRFTTSNATEITTNLCNDPRGTSQLVAMGTTSSITGKHFDIIFTDDIVNVNDRTSKAERDRTKRVYQELQNIKNRGGRIFNTGTPWHKDDAFSIMPTPQIYDCYSTGLISEEELEDIKSKMENSLFAANYEMKHISSDDVLFTSPHINAEPELVEQGEAHIDAAYGGSDYTAYTIVKKRDDKYYVFGKLYHKHIDDCTSEILAIHGRFCAGRIFVEDNGDKGYLARDLKAKGARVHKYHEKTNKYIKITSYLKSEWNNIYFVAGTDEEYLNQILDFNENAEHDDAPDSLSSLIRALWNKKEIDTSNLYYL